MKFVKYNEISIYVDFVVEFKGRNVKVKWSTEDGWLEDRFEDVFMDLSDAEYDEAYEEFIDELPSFSLNMENYDYA